MFAEKIFELRKKKGITQREVADAVGITAASISAYEKGTKIPPLDTAIAVAKYFGVSLDYLCGLQDGDSIKGQNELTRADVLRMLSAIRENAFGVSVYCSTDSDRTPPYTTSILINSKTDWANRYFEKFDTLVKLCKSGDIDAEVLEAWKDKKLSEPEYRILINYPEDNSIILVDDEELPF